MCQGQNLQLCVHNNYDVDDIWSIAGQLKYLLSNDTNYLWIVCNCYGQNIYINICHVIYLKCYIIDSTANFAQRKREMTIFPQLKWILLH